MKNEEWRRKTHPAGAFFMFICAFGVAMDIRNLNRRDCPLDSSLVSVDLTSDGISATGCPQRFALHYGCAFSRNDSQMI